MELNALSEAVIKGNMDQAVAETQKGLEAGVDPQKILDDGLIAAMDVVGEKFSRGTMFVPQMLRSAKTMQACVALLKPQFQAGKVSSKGKIVVGTVKGDLHDIGKNLVAMMLEGSGFTIVDLGVDVAPEKFLQAVTDEKPQIIGMSALLSTTMPAMKATIEALEASGQRGQVKVLIGGAPVTAKFAEEIGADRYAPDAGSAVTEAKALIGGK
ncbi:MAG: corrinoid protein [Desulfobacterales bacterium]|jgi:5-methyltetrahydrofolate--homocysteine methyltransferase